MCGITGIANLATDDLRERLGRMTASLAHRGPDDEGCEIVEGVGLGHRRLTVIDLTANGHQPMANEDRSVWITYNGEIYGTDRIRATLEGLGHRFRSRTDTEVVVHLYEERGRDLFRDLNGMFAFAIHDRQRHRLLLARDRLGIKPLYYAFVGGALLFASELKGVFAGLGHRPSLRPDALGQYLLQGYVSAPDTAFEGVWALPPGCFLDIDLGALSNGWLPSPVEYWDAPFTGDDARPVAEIGAEVEATLADAVRGCMVADVPLGAFLSGGLDSSSVVAMMARAQSEPARTFTLAMPGTSQDEAARALAVAKKFDTAHTVVNSTQRNATDYWRCLEHFDTPFNCPSLLSARMTSAAAREQVVVALSGDGGDELFGGYARYMRIAAHGPRPHARRLFSAAAHLLPRDLRGRARLSDLAHDDFTRYFTIRHPMTVTEAEQLVGTGLDAWVNRMEAIYERYPADRVTRAMYFDVKTYLPDHVLAKVDNASMAVSLEVRVPLLDHRLVELAGRIPASLKIRDGTGKWLLKERARQWLTDDIVDQPKVGFDPPLASWLFDDHLEAGLNEISSTDARVSTVLDRRILAGWIEGLRGRSRWRVPRRAALWSVQQLERWMQTAEPVST